MAQVIPEENAYTPENINRQLMLGRSRDELAVMYGHKNFKTLDMFMRRKGFYWDREKQLYLVKAKKTKNSEEKQQTPTKRIQTILNLFAEGKGPKEVAKATGFNNHLALANYMKEKNYLWNIKTNMYEYQNGKINEEAETEDNVEYPDRNNQHEDLMQFFLNNKNKISEIINNEKKEVPRYKLNGYKISKYFQISHKLEELLKEFSSENNITQREIIEIGIIETLMKYGYAAEIKGVLMSK